MTEFHLMRPEWLWCLVPAAVLTAILWRQRGRNGSWSSVIEPSLLAHLVPDSGGGRRRNLLPWVLLGWVLAVFAAAGPSLQKIPLPVHQKQDAMVIVLDLSYSMKSGDLAPSRIDRARQKLLDLLERRDEGQTGLIAFAGDAHIVTPLTDDTRTIANLLPALNPDMMPVPGSDPVAAVSEAVLLLKSAGISGGRILLVSDAITATEQNSLADTLAGSSANLSIMGIGTATGAPIPLARGGFLKDQEGAIVMPALEEATMMSAAGATGGRYMRLQIDDSDLDYLLAENPLSRPVEGLAIDRSADTWEDQGYLLLLVLAPLVLAVFRRGWIVCMLPLFFFASPEQASASLWEDLWFTPDQQAMRALQRGDPEAAAGLFENAEWAGTASYQAGDYESATDSFSQLDNADSWYNRGNALARSGELQAAIDAYRNSLERDPERKDALENIALLEQMQQQQEQQQQQQGEQQDQDEASNDQQSDAQSQDNEQQSQEESSEADDASPQNSDGQSQDGAEPQSGDEQEQDAGERQRKEEDGEAQAEDAEQPQEQEPGEQDAEAREAQAAQAETDPEQRERDQAMEQWLRRVPDDPSGLLREKFRYQSQQRQRDGSKQNAQVW